MQQDLYFDLMFKNCTYITNSYPVNGDLLMYICIQSIQFLNQYFYEKNFYSNGRTVSCIVFNPKSC